MAQSAGSKFKFVFKKQDDLVLLSKYYLFEENIWKHVDEEYQSIENHRVLTEIPEVSQALDAMQRQRTITVTLSAQDAAPYLEGEYSTSNNNDVDDHNTGTGSSSGMSQSQGQYAMPASLISSIVREVMVSQQQMMQDMLNSFNESIRISGLSKAQRMEINKYDGKNEDPKIWMKTYEKACGCNGWTTDSLKINHLKSHLEGIAIKWYNSRVIEGAADLWEDWKASFERSFGQNRVQLATNANKWEYRGGPLMEYFYEKQRLLQMAYPDIGEHAFITMVILGLPEDMQRQILTTEITSKEGLREALERLKPAFKKKPQEEDKPKKKGFQKDKKVQHGTFNVQSSDSEPELQEEARVNNTIQGSGERNQKLPTFRIKVNDKFLTALFDTGSSLDLISNKVIQDAGWNTIKTFKVLSGFNGNKTLCNEILSITLKYGNKKLNSEAVVVPGLGFEFIVGWPTLEKLKWNFGEKRVYTTGELRVYAKEDIEKLFPEVLKDHLESKHIVPFKLKENPRVIQSKPYRLSRERCAWAQERINELKSRGIIRDSHSEYASPCVIVPKEIGKLRLCQDYREINKETTLDPFPFPIIDDVICNFGGCKYFTKFDLKDGFYLIGLNEETKKFTSFVTPFGHYEFNRLPFGWKNSPPIFQRKITEVLGGLLKDLRVSAYVDDIICGDETLEGNAIKTAKILQKLENAGFTINIEKSQFNVSKVTFLGRVIDGQTKTTKQESVDKVRNMKRPIDLNSLRVFTGLTGHFRAFIPNYAKIIRPLDQLKQKDVPFIWSEDCERAFKILVEKITSNPILQLPDWNLAFELCTDASHLGSGAILYQRNSSIKKSQQLRVIGYYSYTFTKPEINYTVTEKEALAVIKAIKYFRSYLEGREFIVHTDHQALTHIMTLKEPKGRLGRWQAFLMTYNISINHRSGRELKDADAISRLCLDSDEPSSSFDVFVVRESNRLHVNQDQVPLVLRRYHDDPDSGGHDGFMRTYLKIKARFTWPGMKNDIMDYVKSCHDCQVLKFKFRPKPDAMILPVHSQSPFEVLHLDFGEISKKSDGSARTKSFLLVVDEATRLMQAKAMRETSRGVIDYLKNHPYFKNVKTIITDCGLAFTSKAFKAFANSHKIILKTTSPYHPAGNGMAERKMRDIKTFFSLYPNFPGGWKCTLEAGIRHLNRSYCSSIGCTPVFKAFGKSPSLPADAEFNIKSENLKPEKPFTEEQVKRYREKMQQGFNIKHARKMPDIKQGDLILVQSGIKGKNPYVDGPFKVVEVKIIQGIPKAMVYQTESGSTKVASLSNVIPYHQRLDDHS